jgi:signal transduction histidine kinase/CheY-like chemotaxis protein
VSVTDLATRLAPMSRPQDMGERDHFVQFYDHDQFLLSALAEYVGGGLDAGAACIVIATLAHLHALEDLLRGRGIDVVAARERGRYLDRDAAAMLAQICSGGVPQRERFFAAVATLIADALRSHRRVLVFGEMVALLSQAGRKAEALCLEQLSNELGQRHPFSLFCAYPMSSFATAAEARDLRHVCAEHKRVVPAESYTGHPDAKDRVLMICELQQKAAALESEVTERRRLHKELQDRLAELSDKDRRKDEFLAMLGHELRNPLAPMRNVMEMLKRLPDVGDERRRLDEVLERQVRQLTHLVNDLLDVARVTQGKIQLQTQPLELMTVLSGAIEASRSRIDARGHRLSVSLPEVPVRVSGDLTRLVQLFSNLLNNAAKYTPNGGEITVGVVCTESAVEVRISDTGIGIAPELLPRVFDLFAQAERSLARTEGGLGVGLTLARAIAHLHGGNLRATSAGVGHGSTFIATLPALSERTAPREVAHSLEQPVVASRKMRRILVVDDNHDSANSMADLLRMDGHKVVTVFDGASALVTAPALNPDLVLLDIGLPDINGYEVAQNLRAAGSQACVVAMSGYGQPEDRRKATLAGFDMHLVKPIDPDTLRRLLARD